jgi:hypothetical protein
MNRYNDWCSAVMRHCCLGSIWMSDGPRIAVTGWACECRGTRPVEGGTEQQISCHTAVAQLLPFATASRRDSLCRKSFRVAIHVHPETHAHYASSCDVQPPRLARLCLTTPESKGFNAVRWRSGPTRAARSVVSNRSRLQSMAEWAR